MEYDKATLIPDDPKDVASDSKGWAAAAQLLPLLGFWLLAPLIIWLIKRDEDAFVEEHAREALNFHISVFIYAIICVVLVLVIVGIFLGIALAIGAFVLTIVAGVKAASGERYRYPFTIRFVT
jgi:uncharacterized protein